MTKLKLVQSAFLYGYVNGEQILISNAVDQICAFIMDNRLAMKKITDPFDKILIEIDGEIIMYCINQEYLRTILRPTLVAMQLGQVDIPEFVPHEVVARTWTHEEMKYHLEQLGFELTDDKGEYSLSKMIEIATYECYDWDEEKEVWFL